MPQACTVCTSDKRAEIDKALVAGKPKRRVAESHGLAETSVGRHAANHLPSRLMRAADVRERMEANDLIGVVRGTVDASMEVLESTGDGELRLKAVDRVQRGVSVIADVESKAIDNDLKRVLGLWGLKELGDLERLAEERKQLASATPEDLFEAACEGLRQAIEQRPGLAASVMERIPQLRLMVAEG